jgi:hypothetical protein
MSKSFRRQGRAEGVKWMVKGDLQKESVGMVQPRASHADMGK